MPAISLPPSALSLAPAARLEAAGWAAGLAFTFVLFFSLAQIEKVAGGSPEPEIADLPVVTLPLEETPPPRATPPPPSEDPPPPLTGIEASASDSAVKITVMPPDLEALLPPERIPPATVSLGRVPADLKPHATLELDERHVYQQSEVDQRPRAVVRVAPPVPGHALGEGQALAVNLLLLINVDGRAESVRVLGPSGQPEFDAVVAETVKDSWVFSPAIRRGKKVRCLVEQSIRVKIGGGGSPFETR